MRQLSSESSNKCSTMVSTEQPSVIISQPSRIQSVGQPFGLTQPHIAYGGNAMIQELVQPLVTFQNNNNNNTQNTDANHSDGESSPLQYSTLHPIDQHHQSPYATIIQPVPVSTAENHQWSYDSLDLRSNNICENAKAALISYGASAVHGEIANQYVQRSLVITQTGGHHFPADVTEMRDNLHPYAAISPYGTPAGVQDSLNGQSLQEHRADDNNNTLQSVDEVIADTLKDDHCLHHTVASPASQNGSPVSHAAPSPDHHHQGHPGVSAGDQYLNLGSAQSTISENLHQLKYSRIEHARSDSRSSPVSQESDYDSDLHNFTQLTSVVQSRNNNNSNNLVTYSPTSQAGSTIVSGVHPVQANYENIR